MQSYGAFDLSKFAENKHRFYDLGTKRMADVAEELEAQMMATATLINVGTPGSALAISNGSESTVGSSTNTFVGALVTCSSPNSALNLNSVSLGAGTWVVLGMYLSPSSYPTDIAGLYLNSASAVASNSWTTINQGSGVYNSTPFMVGAVVKLTGTTTIYLNCEFVYASDKGYGFLVAVQIA